MPSKYSYSESLKYSTKLFEGVSGVTNTEPKITEPKRVCKYTAVTFFTEKHRIFLHGFMAGLTFKVLHPLWGRSGEITSNNTGTTIYCDVTNSDFIVGEEVFLVLGYDSYKILTLSEVWADYIVVNESVETTENQLVLPSFYGILTGSIDSNYTGENYATCTISVEELR